MKNDNLFYKHEAFDQFTFSTFSILLIMGVMVFVLSYIYASIIVYNPFSFLNGFVFLIGCITLAGITRWGVQKTRFQSKQEKILLGATIGLITLYFTWTLYLKVSFSGHVNEIFLHPLVIWEGMIKLANEGWNMEWPESGDLLLWVHGDMLWFAWGIEALGFLIVPIFYAYQTKPPVIVFCKTCNKWADKESFLVFLFSDEEELKQNFMAQDLSFLKKAKRTRHNALVFYVISVKWCDTCDGLYTLSLQKIQKPDNVVLEYLNGTVDEFLTTYGGFNAISISTIYQDLLVSQQVHENIFKASAEKGFGEFVHSG